MQQEGNFRDRMSPNLPSPAAGGTVAAPASRPRSGRGGRARTAPRAWLRRLGVATAVIAAIVIALLATAAWVDHTGRAFFDRGSAAVAALDRLAASVAAGDPAAISGAYAPAFAAPPLGLDRRALFEDRDGIRRYRLGRPAGAEPAALLDRSGAAAEWSAYRAGFASVDELRMHLEDIETWKSGGPLTATVRFELIGTPRGEARAGVDRALLRIAFVPRGDGSGRFLIGRTELIEGERQAATQPQLVDVAAQAGIDFENRYYPPFLEIPMAFGMLRYGPAGITAADVDDDGWEDLFIPDGVASRLFRNRGDGTFEDVTAASGLTGLSGVSVALFADYDDDGARDLFVSRTFEPNQLFHNRGDGTFEDVTATSGLGADCCTTVASWADYDLDGDLDLYVGRYLDPRREVPTTFYARNGEPNRLYRNDGGGRFTDVTAHAGVGDTGLCLGTVFGDYDDDGDPDLYVVNDFGRKTLYRNEGDGTFRDVTVESGSLAYGAGMSASFGDYDNDGRLDLYVAHIRSDFSWFAEPPTVARYMANSLRQGVWRTDLPLYAEIVRQSGLDFVGVFRQMASGNTLLRNRGDGTFEDVTAATGANPPGWFWGSGFADFDNDGWQDVYAANGWVYGEPGSEIELGFLDNVVSHQRRYKTGEFFDPRSFAGRLLARLRAQPPPAQRPRPLRRDRPRRRRRPAAQQPRHRGGGFLEPRRARRRGGRVHRPPRPAAQPGRRAAPLPRLRAARRRKRPARRQQPRRRRCPRPPHRRRPDADSRGGARRRLRIAEQPAPPLRARRRGGGRRGGGALAALRPGADLPRRRRGPHPARRGGSADAERAGSGEPRGGLRARELIAGRREHVIRARLARRGDAGIAGPMSRSRNAARRDAGACAAGRGLIHKLSGSVDGVGLLVAGGVDGHLGGLAQPVDAQ